MVGRIPARSCNAITRKPAGLQSAAYTPQPGVPAGACGWTQSIQYNGDDQDNHFNALQVTVAKTILQGAFVHIELCLAAGFRLGFELQDLGRAGGQGAATTLFASSRLFPMGTGRSLSAETDLFVEVARVGGRSGRRLGD